MKSNLQAKVDARNLVNQAVKDNAQMFFDACAPFVGQQIVKADGYFTKKFLAAMPNVGFCWGQGRYSLSRTFKACEAGERSSFYAEAMLYIGDLDGGVLKNLNPNFKPEFYPSNYDAAEVEKARLEVRDAEEALRKAQSKIHLFGTHDNN